MAWGRREEQASREGGSKVKGREGKWSSEFGFETVSLPTVETSSFPLQRRCFTPRFCSESKRWDFAGKREEKAS